MRKKLVYICSPCRGDIEKNIEKAQRYCREAVELWDDVIPIAPHVYFTQFLDDTKPEERAAGMDMGLSLLAMCDELWVYGIENPSEGMRNEIEYAKQHQIPIRHHAGQSTILRHYRQHSQIIPCHQPRSNRDRFLRPDADCVQRHAIFYLHGLPSTIPSCGKSVHFKKIYYSLSM